MNNTIESFFYAQETKVLDEEKQKELLKKTYVGDKKARNELIVHNIRLVMYIVTTRFANTGLDQEELISVGIIGLIKAIDSFDSTKDTKLATYSCKCIKNEILMYLRKNLKHIDVKSFNEYVDNQGVENDKHIVFVAGEENKNVVDEVEKSICLEEVKTAITQLSGLDKEVMELRYGLKDGLYHEQNDVAKTLGLSQPYVSRIIKRSLIKIKKKNKY